VIGRLYDLGRLKQGLKVACAELRPHGASDFAHAIMTTDTRPKVSCTTLALGGRDVTLMGIAKGAGMIAPAMATMLAFIVTDANASSGLLRQALKKALPTSFNALTVDGDMSTNDAVLLLASGRAANSALSSRLEVEKFEQAVSAIAKDLARQIAEDGEGATKLAIVRVKGARSRAEADKVARRIANSPLVKTALFGCDPNVGRILAAAGACGVKFDPERVELSVGRARIAAHGRIIESALDKARQAMQAREVEICVDLKQGDAEAVVLTCDLSVDYVRINAEYTT
jgi:glutamate N-acetyltransferase/amino-acid N-acetyltransferase